MPASAGDHKRIAEDCAKNKVHIRMLFAFCGLEKIVFWKFNVKAFFGFLEAAAATIPALE